MTNLEGDLKSVLFVIMLAIFVTTMSVTASLGPHGLGPQGDGLTASLGHKAVVGEIGPVGVWSLAGEKSHSIKQQLTELLLEHSRIPREL